MLRGKKTTKAGQQLILGDNAPPCQLVDIDFKVLSLNDFNKIPKLIYTYPTIETDKCFNNLKRLKAFTQIFKNHQFIAVSVDLLVCFLTLSFLLRVPPVCFVGIQKKERKEDGSVMRAKCV